MAVQRTAAWLKRIGDDRKALRIGGKQPIEFAV